LAQAQTEKSHVSAQLPRERLIFCVPSGAPILLGLSLNRGCRRIFSIFHFQPDLFYRSIQPTRPVLGQRNRLKNNRLHSDFGQQHKRCLTSADRCGPVNASRSPEWPSETRPNLLQLLTAPSRQRREAANFKTKSAGLKGLIWQAAVSEICRPCGVAPASPSPSGSAFRSPLDNNKSTGGHKSQKARDGERCDRLSTWAS
jgi:hypothetical protein